MLALAATSGFSLGYAFGLTGFDDKDPLDEPPAFAAWIFRIVVLILIVGISIYGGVARTGDTGQKIDQFLYAAFAYAVGVFLHREFNEFKINIDFIDRLLDGAVQTGGPSKKTVNEAMVHLATYFYGPYLSDIEIAHSLKKLRAFRNADSLSLLVRISHFKTNSTPPRRVLAQYGIETPSQLKTLFSALLKIGAENFIFQPEFIQRLRLVAGSAGLPENLFERLLHKYQPGPGQRRQYREAETESYQRTGNNSHNRGHVWETPVDETADKLALFGLTRSASKKELKQRYRKMAIKYHPDRNMGPEKSDEHRAKALEKMTELNTAYDWLKANWTPGQT